MGDKSAQLLNLYQRLIDRVKSEYAQDPNLTTKDLLTSVTSGRTYLKLKEQADEEELALVEHFLKRDIIVFLSEQNANNLSFSPTLLSMENTFWHWLGEITDRSQVEWHELAQDLKNQGQYNSGEIVGQGRMICDHCGHLVDIEFPSVLLPCSECDNKTFTREALRP